MSPPIITMLKKWEKALPGATIFLNILMKRFRWDGFRAVNDIAYSEEEIRAFSKSKYILSDTEEIYLRAAKEVRAGKKVLFSGTPCQVAAFRNIVGEQDNLLLVDLVCHGAPSQKLLQMHLEELAGRKGKTIKSWSFRDKTPVKGLVSSRSARVDFEDGSWQHFEIKDDAYLQLYYARLAYREACGNCIYARPERISDITVCDAHHIGELYPDLSMEKGASTILFHTEKGMGLLAGIRDSMDLKDVDFVNGRLIVTLKGGNDGYSYFGQEVEDTLRDYIENGRPMLEPAINEEALFLSVRHTRMTVRAMELLVKDYCSRAGIADADRITPHKLRATYGTHLYEQSGDIKLVASTLHHKSVETTSKHYVKDSEEHHRKVILFSDTIFDKQEH